MSTKDEPVDLTTIPVSPGGDNSDKKPEASEEQITVFHDKDNFNVKHPLMHKWTLWFTKPPSGKVGDSGLFAADFVG
jgi:translation initiation factor 4E